MSHPQHAATQQPTAAPKQRRPRKGLAVTALVLGIVAICGSPIPILNNATIIAGALGVVFAVVALFGTHRVMAGIGMVLAVGGIVVGIVLQYQWGKALDEVSRDIGGHSATAKQDVTISQCDAKTGYGTTEALATVTISNPTGQAQSYMATIAVNADSGDRLGEITVFANSLAPHQKTTITGPRASAPIPSGSGNLHCTVASVDRYAG